MMSGPATSVAKAKHLVRGLEYLVPANFTNPKNIQAYFTALAPDARFDSIFAYIMSNFQESVKAVTRDTSLQGEVPKAGKDRCKN